MDTEIRKLVIVGGGTAGWMTAAALAKSLGTDRFSITLVESDAIGTVGVGEATIPPSVEFNAFLGINEADFMRSTQATIKLGIEFLNWGKLGTRYFHPFGQFGADIGGLAFHHYLLRWTGGQKAPDLGKFNLETIAAGLGKYGRVPGEINGRPARLNFAYQFDASLYAQYLRNYSEARGVQRVEGRILDVTQDAVSGYIRDLRLEGGVCVDGDLFFDCSGFRGLLIEETLKCGYEDWSRWLPCDRAWAVPCDHLNDGNITPFTRSTARSAGWQWRIPLQHRIGNGYVFCSSFLSEDAARDEVLSALESPAGRDPKLLKFVTGHRRQIWNRNVVAIGLSSGFLEPLESTSIHLAQVGIHKILANFPKTIINPAVRSRYNREMKAEYENVKDFLIAHYKITQRDDTDFWRYCRDMEVPESLQTRLEIYKATGDTGATAVELFKDTSWVAVLVGQGLLPGDHHVLAEAMPRDELDTSINGSVRRDSGHVGPFGGLFRRVLRRQSDVFRLQSSYAGTLRPSSHINRLML